MNYILFDDLGGDNFRPLTFTRTTADLFAGCFTNRQRWSMMLNAQVSSLTHEYLQKKFPISIQNDNTLINGRLIPSKSLLKDLSKLAEGEILVHNETVLAARLNERLLNEFLKKADESEKYDRHAIFSKMDVRKVRVAFTPVVLQHLWDLFEMNDDLIKMDKSLMNLDSFGADADENSKLIGDDIFIHTTARVNASIINASNGPVIIDEGAEVMEGCMIRGPFYLGKNSVLKMGTKIYGATSIGHYSKIGGEVTNSVVNSYSNKAHDGFLGNSVIGEWCNLGADTNTSNLKNDYGTVKFWNYRSNEFEDSMRQFLGLVMGDHSKCGINTMFNTGTVVGVSCNIYGGDFIPKLIPSFSWGGSKGFDDYIFEKAIKVVERVMERRDLTLGENDASVLRYLFENSQELRKKYH